MPDADPARETTPATSMVENGTFTSGHSQEWPAGRQPNGARCWERHESHPRAADLRDIRDGDKPASAPIAEKHRQPLAGLHYTPLRRPSRSRKERVSESDLVFASFGTGAPVGAWRSTR